MATGFVPDVERPELDPTEVAAEPAMYVGVGGKWNLEEVPNSTEQKTELGLIDPEATAYEYWFNKSPISEDGTLQPSTGTDTLAGMLYELSTDTSLYNFYKDGENYIKVYNVIDNRMEYAYTATKYLLTQEPGVVGGPGVARKVAKAYLGISGKYSGIEEVAGSTTTGSASEFPSPDDPTYEYWLNKSPLSENNTLQSKDGDAPLSSICYEINTGSNSYAFIEDNGYYFKIINPEFDGKYFTFTKTKYLLTPNYGELGIAHTVKKGYVGDSNGKARLFFSSGPKIVSWATGSDADVAAMITAAHNGEIKLADYWKVGDTRTVSLSAGTNSAGTAIPAQSVELVLAHKPTSTSYYGGGEFIINQKNCLSVYNHMNSDDTNSGSFAGSAMASFLNNTSTGYLKMLPTWLSSVLLDAKVITAQTYNGTINQKSTHKVFLPAAKEIFGGTATSAGSGTSYSNLTEFNALEQWEWFKTTANRIKQNSGSNCYWWERSPYYNDSIHFCYVLNSGRANANDAGYTHGVAPAMLI